MLLQPNDHVLFYGDSITDAGRSRENSTNTGLGEGYAMLCTAALRAAYPEWNLTFTNTGIGGNRVTDLEARIEADALAYKPNLVSILIGINDAAGASIEGNTSAVETFEASYRRVLTRFSENGSPQLLIMEPFLLHSTPEQRTWRPILDPMIHVCRDLAREFGAAYLPLDGIFAAAATRQTLDYWMPDGVHPTLAGHALMTDNWLDLVTS
jgi:acyl-CoA thioesterase-1